MKEYRFVVIERVKKTVCIVANDLLEAQKEMQYCLDGGEIEMDKNPDEISRNFYVVDVSPIG